MYTRVFLATVVRERDTNIAFKRTRGVVVVVVVVCSFRLSRVQNNRRSTAFGPRATSVCSTARRVRVKPMEIFGLRYYYCVQYEIYTNKYSVDFSVIPKYIIIVGSASF